MTPSATPIGPCSPFFIVSDITVSLAHYRDRLGFDVRYCAPADDPFFAIVGRDTAQILLKVVDNTDPLPNPARHAWASWDAFIFVADPDALAQEFDHRGVTFRRAIGDTDDGLRGFEIADPDGYVCFMGRPLG